MADWIECWHSEKLKNCEKFTLSTQTAFALQRTLRCHAAIIEDLLNEGYQFVLAVCFK